MSKGYGSYEAALETYRKAARKWREVQSDYRSRKIGDHLFLEGKAAFEFAQEALDKAEKELLDKK